MQLMLFCPHVKPAFHQKTDSVGASAYALASDVQLHPSCMQLCRCMIDHYGHGDSPRNLLNVLPSFRSRSQQNSSPQRPVGASPMRHSTSLSSSHMQSAYGQPLQLRPSGRVVSNAVSRPQASMHAASVSRVHSSSDRIAAVQGNLIQRQSSNSVSDGTRFSRSGSQK